MSVPKKSKLPWEAEIAFAALALVATDDCPTRASDFLRELRRWTRPRLIGSPPLEDWWAEREQRDDSDPWLEPRHFESIHRDANDILHGAHLLLQDAPSRLPSLGDRFVAQVAVEAAIETRLLRNTPSSMGDRFVAQAAAKAAAVTGLFLPGSELSPSGVNLLSSPLKAELLFLPRSELSRTGVGNLSSQLKAELWAFYEDERQRRAHESLRGVVLAQIRLGATLLDLTLDQRHWRVVVCDECKRFFLRYGRHNLNRPHTFCSPRCRVAFKRSSTP